MVLDNLRQYFNPPEEDDEFKQQKSIPFSKNDNLEDKIMLKALKVLSRIIGVDLLMNIRKFATACG